MKKIFGSPQKKNQEIIDLINKTKINLYYLKNNKDFRDNILSNIKSSDEVLDIGKGMREKFSLIESKKIETLDINDYGSYPDIICDICDLEIDNFNELKDKYDKIICIAVLEHVYDPFKAIKNIKYLLKKNGLLMGFVPYLYEYHAPQDLKFQDYFRFSRDALSYLFKDFSEVELFPYRGRFSTSFKNLIGSQKWKKYFEKFGLNILLDKFSNDEINKVQSSGYFFLVKK